MLAVDFKKSIKDLTFFILKAKWFVLLEWKRMLLLSGGRVESIVFVNKQTSFLYSELSNDYFSFWGFLIRKKKTLGPSVIKFCILLCGCIESSCE